MSSAMLTTIQTQMNLYGYSTLMVLGSIGNIFILILFNRQRQNACSIYLMNAAVTNILCLAVAGFSAIFILSYNDSTLRALVSCKIITYIPSFLGQVSKTLLVLACIDRYLITSDRVRFRAFSTPKRAKYFVFFTYVLWSIAASHVLILNTSINGQCTRVGIYATVFTFYGIFVVGLIPSITLSMFTYLTYRNLKRMRNRVQPNAHDGTNMNNILQRRDRDLLILVIAEAGVYILTTSPFSVVLLEMMISQYVTPMKSSQYFQAELFALNVAVFLIFTFSAAPFYIYMIASAAFRRDFKQLIMISYRKLAGQTAEQTATQINQPLPQQDTRV